MSCQKPITISDRQLYTVVVSDCFGQPLGVALTGVLTFSGEPLLSFGSAPISSF
jgi:hypothetical protein